MRKLMYTFFLTVGCGLFDVNVAHAIITRHDRPDADYIVTDSAYPALVDLLGVDNCIGTLVHESYLLTVAHCAVDLAEGNSLSINGVPNTVAEVIIHPKWKASRDEYDIALVRLKKSVKDVTPIPIYRNTNELDSLITLVGRGVHATGLKGQPGGTDDGKLRRATNRVSAVSRHFIETIFERPGENGVTAFEGVGAKGDSGCPAFISINGVSYIAGLNSWGEGGKGIEVGQYGARDYQTRVSQYLEWLDDILAPAPLIATLWN